MNTYFKHEIYAGEARPITVDSVTDQDGNAINLTDADIHYYANTPVPIHKSIISGVADDIVMVDAQQPEFYIEFDEADTILNGGCVFHHECVAILSNDQRLVIFYGSLIVHYSGTPAEADLLPEPEE